MDIEEIKSAVERGLADVTNANLGRFAAIEKKQGALEALLAKMETKLGRPNMIVGGSDNAELKAELEALGAYVAHKDASKLVEVKAMNAGTDPEGGYLVLPAISKSMATKIFDQSPMKRLARLETIDSGDTWEEVVDNDEPDAEWVAEQQTRNETGSPDLGKHVVALHEIHASPKVTQKLLDVSHFDVGQWLEGKVADKFGRTEGAAFISGNGVGKPFGLLSGTPVTTGDATRAWKTLQYFPSGVAADLADATTRADVFRNMLWGLRAPYRAGANWLMNSNTANKIDKIKNENGDYLWRDSMGAGLPPTLLGYPVEFDENMPDVAAGAFPVAFGNFKLGYVVIELKGLRVLRDPISAKPNVVFYTYKRVGGDISNSEAIKLLKIATT